ncbi:MAG: sigma-70 family RNA polymerase sigma factor [Saprospiraceae bacterium]|nr:sigma-70 family RNA polymerase sigma factor [Saprospiraceae bacterium]
MRIQKVIKELQQGQMAGLAKLQRAYWKRMFRTLRSQFSLNEMELEDIVANTFIAFYENVVNNNYQEEASIFNYLMLIAKRKAINLVNEKKRHREKHEEIAYTIPQFLDPGQHELAKDQAMQVKLLMEQLPEDEARLLTLFYFHRWGMDDIARELGLKNADSAKDKKRRIIRKLQQMLVNKD